MPQPHTAKLPEPKSADEFEEMCVEALRIRLGVPAQRNGRSGQRQDGVDIIARTGAVYVGAQCKNTNSLDATTVRSLAAAARAFKPTLVSFLVLTTLPRDARLQEDVRVHFHKHPEPFTVDVIFWEDLVAHLTSDRAVVEKFWSWNEGIAAWVPRREGELRHLRNELARIAKFGDELNTRRYYYRQMNEIPPREYSETCGHTDFEALWSRLSVSHSFDAMTRSHVDGMRDAMRSWDTVALEFSRRLREYGGVTWPDMDAQDAAATTYGLRMNNNALHAVRLLDQQLGAGR